MYLLMIQNIKKVLENKRKYIDLLLLAGQSNALIQEVTTCNIILMYLTLNLE